MDHIEDISLEDLQQALDQVEGKKPAMRLLAAIAYKNGVTQTELAEWYGVQRRTVYSWLKRLEEPTIENAVRDAHRSGRPRKLTEEQQASLQQVLRRSPTGFSDDAVTWTPELVRQYIHERFGIDYSLPSCRRLMKESGLRFCSLDDYEGSEFPTEPLDEETKHWLPE
ncbi:transposase [Halocatena pleomorpha]|uniref:Transposase n=1 Tax=Halocatena pleomorpha TaxID=1785090 RepID=A0A3P3RGD3_9EURY|nr:transposase [Halocatena pleomorpha]